MIKNYQRNWGSIKDFIKLLSHCYHNDQAVKMGELHVFSEVPISKEKATDIYTDVQSRIYAITKEDSDEPGDYYIQKFSPDRWEKTEVAAIARRFGSSVRKIARLFFYERPEEWAFHIVDIKQKYNRASGEVEYGNEIIFELWCKDIEKIDVKAEFDKILEKYNINSNVSTIFKLKSVKYSTTPAGKDLLERDILGNIPEPGDTVILTEGGADIFVGFNKASWRCLHSCGYGYVVKKHPVNTNGGEPLKTPEAFDVQA